MDYISEEKYKHMGGVKLQKDDILYCLRGSLGKNAILDIDSGTVASSLVALRGRRIVPKYLFYMLNSHIEEVQRKLWDNGTAQPNLSADNLGKFKTCVPSEDEQYKIIKYLNEKTDVINSIIKKKQEELRTVKQHKESLIYEYVTGKKRVKEAL
jgi:type I restriction enzyme S subunit